MTPPHERRRAEDVFQAIENDVFPRLKKIDDKIEDLEGGIVNLQVRGCAHREGDTLRMVAVESQVTKIFDKIDTFGTTLGEHRVDVTKQIGGIRTWVLTGVAAVLMALLSFFAVEYFNSIGQHLGK